MEMLNDYYKDKVIHMIKGGFYSSDDIIEQMAELDVEPEQLKAFVESEYNAHVAKAKKSNDVMILQQVFDELITEGYIALHNRFN